jgi:drug/metabolite transporter superfamily protein YnfA
MFVFEASAIPDAWTVTVQTVSAGRLKVGVSVCELAGEELVVNGIGVPDGHSSENALLALTDLLKLIVIVVFSTTLVAPFVGTVLVTVGGVSVVNENV